MNTKPDCEPFSFEEQNLLNQVREGKLAPEQAEHINSEAGRKPLAREPDPVGWNPDAEDFWTLAMAVAWVAWRSTDRVREFWDEYQEARWVWRSRRLLRGENEGRGAADVEYFLGHPTRPTIADVVPYQAMIDAEERGEIIGTFEDIRLAAQRGDLTVAATSLAEHKDVVIPAAEWGEPLGYLDHGRDTFLVTSSGERRYRNPRFRRVQLIACFSTITMGRPASHAISHATATIDVETKCRRTVVEIMRLSPNCPRPKNQIKKEISCCSTFLSSPS